MAEAATNPEAGVEQQSVEQRLVSFYAGRGEKAAPKETPAPAAEEAPANAEAAPEAETDDQAYVEAEEAPLEDVELPDDTPSPAPEFEIVHNGQQHKLTRAETIELAQKGFDYTSKTQSLAQRESQISEALGAAQQIAQMQAALAPEIAQVEGFRTAVNEYKDVNWVQLAQQDSSLYAQHRARYDQLRDGLQASESVLNQKFTVIHQGQQQAQATLLQAEQARLAELMPWWKDSKRQSAEVKALTEAAIADGYTVDELKSIPQAKYVRTLWKAKEYDRMMKSQGPQLKKMREAPPMAKPGSANPAPPPGVQREQQLRAQLKKSGSVESAAELFAMRERRKMK